MGKSMMERIQDLEEEVEDLKGRPRAEPPKDGGVFRVYEVRVELGSNVKELHRLLGDLPVDAELVELDRDGGWFVFRFRDDPRWYGKTAVDRAMDDLGFGEKVSESL